MWLKRQGIYQQVRKYVEGVGKPFNKELQELYVSPVIAEAILNASPGFASNAAEVKSLIKAQFPKVERDVSSTEMVETINDALSSSDSRFPCTLIVLDEVQVYIGDNSDRALKIQEVTEDCVKKFGGKLLFVATGQSALSGTPQLQRIQGRFRISIHLSDTDVETVIRNVVLAKRPDKISYVKDILSTNSGEISRHLTGTKIEPRTEDRDYDVADYPLLPVRNRFWERVLRALDHAGTSGQLRTQLRIVHEGVKRIAEEPLGTVVGGDFIYDQISTDLLQTGTLLGEINELIQRQRNGTPEGDLCARLCSLIFLIGKLPREGGVDTGIRAMPDMLADLLVRDLKTGSFELRKKIPELLKELVDSGSLMQVENEYRLQTRESSAWENEFRDRLAKKLNDDKFIADERAAFIRKSCNDRIKSLKLLHGNSKVSRKIELCFAQPPDNKGQTIPLWIRNGWEEDDNSVMADVRKAGMNSPVIHIFIPRRSSDELKKTIAEFRAAQETLNARGVPTTAAGLEARQAMETRKELAGGKEGEGGELNNNLNEIFNGARVFLSGGSECAGSNLNEAVREAAEAALTRLFPQFDVADDPQWEKVIQRAKKGDGGALEALGYSGEPEAHPVCAALLRELGAGKKGSELRRSFAIPPYGWSQDAVDGALLVLFVSGKIKASQDGRLIELKQLDQTKIGVAEFRAEQAVVTASQRLGVRKLFQQAGIDCKPNDESIAAEKFVAMMSNLAESAGGDAPLPVEPDGKHLQDISRLSGNEQLIAIYDNRDRLMKEFQDWQRMKELIGKRWPRWEALKQLLGHASDLPVFDDVNTQVAAIVEQRSLLNDPDNVPALCDQLNQALREALLEASRSYDEQYGSRMSALISSQTWQKLNEEQRSQILTRCQISSATEVRVGNEADILRSLEAISLESWRNLLDALPQRFARAIEEAAKLLEPKASRVELPSRTLQNEADVDEWLTETRKKIVDRLKSGPVIV